MTWMAQAGVPYGSVASNGSDTLLDGSQLGNESLCSHGINLHFFLVLTHVFLLGMLVA